MDEAAGICNQDFDGTGKAFTSQMYVLLDFAFGISNELKVTTVYDSFYL